MRKLIKIKSQKSQKSKIELAGERELWRNEKGMNARLLGKKRMLQ